MNKLINIILLVFVTNTMATAQCGVNGREIIDKYCEGEFLKSKELRKDAVFFYVLSKDTDYFVYLLNPNGEFPKVKILNSRRKRPAYYTYKKRTDKEGNYRVIKFKLPKTGIYLFEIDFPETDENPCILLAMSLKRD